MHLAWAEGGWITEAELGAAMCASRETLVKWGVLTVRAGPDGDVFRLQETYHALRERIGRCYAAQRIKTMAVWWSGPYASILLLSEDLVVAANQAMVLRHRCVRIFRMEEAVAREVPPRGLAAFEAQLVLHHGVYYRELLVTALEAKGARTEVLRDMASAPHECAANEKAIEDVFKVLRHAGKVTGENRVMSLDRMQATIRNAMEHTFPNVRHPRVVGADWERREQHRRTHTIEELHRNVKCSLEGGRISLDAYRASRQDASFLGKPRDANRPLALDTWRAQAGLEYCLDALPLAGGEVTSWKTCTLSWLTSLIPGVHEQAPTQLPAVIAEKRTKAHSVALTHLAGRCLVCWPLTLNADDSMAWTQGITKPPFILVTDVSAESEYAIVPVVVGHGDGYEVVYRRTGPNQSILEWACRRGLAHVTDQVMEWLLEHLDLKAGGADRRTQLAAILACYAKAWGMSEEQQTAILDEFAKAASARKRKAESEAKAAAVKKAAKLADGEILEDGQLGKPGGQGDSDDEDSDLEQGLAKVAEGLLDEDPEAEPAAEKSAKVVAKPSPDQIEEELEAMLRESLVEDLPPDPPAKSSSSKSEGLLPAGAVDAAPAAPKSSGTWAANAADSMPVFADWKSEAAGLEVVFGSSAYTYVVYEYKDGHRVGTDPIGSINWRRGSAGAHKASASWRVTCHRHEGCARSYSCKQWPDSFTRCVAWIKLGASGGKADHESVPRPFMLPDDLVAESEVASWGWASVARLVGCCSLGCRCGFSLGPAVGRRSPVCAAC